ncbi:MAG TPA: peptidylprolyl isomerase [Gaiellaceae bacterium]|nr:peptidylprolyl isomerase [Gaiellaceae bacterium]
MTISRLLPLPLVLAAAVLVAGCGGSSKNVPPDAVAVVGSETITKAQYNDLLASAKQTYKARKTAFPKVGTAAYKSLSDQAVTYLVQEAELEQKGKEIGVTITDKDIQARIDQIKKQYFDNDQKKYEAQLKAQGLTEDQLRVDLRGQLLSEKIYNKVTAGVKVGDKEVKSYYTAHQADYGTPASRTVRHILVSSKAKADDLEQQLKGGADFATLAKKYSKDTQSAKDGGKLTITKGQTVPPFDKAAFSLDTNEISKPVHSTYGWHIIQPLGPVKPAKTTPLKQVEETIRQTLVSQKKTKVMTAWVDKLKKEYSTKVAYQSGYQPATTDTTASDTTATDQ